MPKYRGTFSVDTNFFGRLDGIYHIHGYTLIPCVITPRNQQRGCSSFVLQFDFDGVDEKDTQNSSEQAEKGFANSATAMQIAETFISWLVTCTRVWARLSSDSCGGMTRFGPSNHVLVEEYDEQTLETLFHVARGSKIGEFIQVKRPNLGDVKNAHPTLRLPTDFLTLTQKLFSLDETERKKFLDACFTYQFAQETWSRYPSVSIVALVSSVESIMAEEYSSGFCEDAQKKCPLKRDVMAKFRKFFEHNLQYPLPKELKSFLDSVYSRRSKYVHTSLLGEQKIRGLFHLYRTIEGREAKNEQESLERLVSAGLIEWLKRI